MPEARLSQRIDVWLWHARFYKTRSLATKMIRGGKVRLNGSLCKKASSLIVCNDILTFIRSDEILIAKVVSIGTRRGPAPEAQMLYENLTLPKEAPQQKSKDMVAVRPRGSGRPTKTQRRAIDKLMNK